MLNENLTKAMLVDIFGESIINNHISFIEHCVRIKKNLPKHVTFDKVLQKIALDRGYVLVAQLIFVHSSRLPQLKAKLEKEAAIESANNAEIIKAAKLSIPLEK